MELDLPLFVHERDAAEDMVKILSSFPKLPPTVIHCFTGTAKQVTDFEYSALFRADLGESGSRVGSGE